jgi:hypothetical protein
MTGKPSSVHREPSINAGERPGAGAGAPIGERAYERSLREWLLSVAMIGGYGFGNSPS